MLDLATEQDFLRRIQDTGDPEALSSLLVSHVRLVLSIAQKYTRHGLPIDDLVAEGNLGLVEAARRFDRSRGTRFSTYAAWWIRALIRRYTMSNRRIVGTPSTRAARRLLSSMRATQRRLAAELGQPAAGCAACAAPCESSCRFEIPIKTQLTRAHDLLSWNPRHTLG